MFKIPHSKRPAPKHNSKNGLCMENVQKYHFWGDRLDCWFLGVLFSWKFRATAVFQVVPFGDFIKLQRHDFYCTSVVLIIFQKPTHLLRYVQKSFFGCDIFHFL